MSKKLIILSGIIIILLFIAFESYNSCVDNAQTTDATWAQVQNVYQRRADLIPNLIQTVQGAANFEKSTILEVTKARASIGKVNITQNQAPTDPNQIEKFQQAQGQLSSAISRLLIVAENYPSLKTTSNFRDLQVQIEGSENRIANARGRFNEAVQVYNTKIRTLPVVLFANMLGFHPKPYFQSNADATKVPNVKFNFDNTFQQK